MQLKLRRSQRQAGIVSTSVVFCLDARAELTDRERYNVSRYKLYDQVIYNSEASKRHIEQGLAAHADGTARGGLKALGHLAMAKLQLNVTVRSLESGQHIACKSLEELLAAEEAIKQACLNLQTYLDMAATFDGSDVLYECVGGELVIVSQVARPEPILAPVSMPAEWSTIEQAGPAGALGTPEAKPEAFADSTEADYEPASNEYVVVGNRIDKAFDRISAVTGFNESHATFIAIGWVVLVLVLLVAKCHG